MMLLLISLTGFACYSQDNESYYYFPEKNTISPVIDSIDYESFSSIRKIGIKSAPYCTSIYLPEEINRATDSIWKAEAKNKEKNIKRVDSIVRSLKEKHPSTFYEKDSCLFLNSTDSVVKICIWNNPGSRENTSYRFVDYEHNYLVIEKSGYEFWQYILFNPKTRNYKVFLHEPTFINDSIAYCSANYYGSGDFQIMHLSGISYFGLSFIVSLFFCLCEPIKR